MAVTAGCCGGGGGDFSCADLATCSITALSDVDTTTAPPADGDALVFQGGQWVPGTLADAATATACGLTGDGSAGSPLAVAGAAAWGDTALPFTCADTSGVPVYCDTAGELRTAPEKFIVSPIQSQVSPQDVFPGAAGTATDLFDVTITVTNPSSCRNMNATLRVWSDGVIFDQSPGNEWALRLGLSSTIDGTGPAQPVNNIEWHRARHHADTPGQSLIRFPPAAAPYPVVQALGPGETFKLRITADVLWIAVNTAPWTAGDPVPALHCHALTIDAIGYNL